jgi:DNA-directed RNA polymerase subunit E'/Rpb7
MSALILLIALIAVLAGWVLLCRYNGFRLRLTFDLHLFPKDQISDDSETTA